MSLDQLPLDQMRQEEIYKEYERMQKRADRTHLVGMGITWSTLIAMFIALGVGIEDIMKEDRERRKQQQHVTTPAESEPSPPSPENIADEVPTTPPETASLDHSEREV